ncbi:MAG: AraC family transcriptional regulator [Lautropia sp.]
MDALSDVLRISRLSGGLFMRAELSAPWCVSTRILPSDCAPWLDDGSRLIPYHYVLDGSFRARVPGGPPWEFQTGEVMLLPGNDLHLMGSDLAIAPVQAGEVVRRWSDGRLNTIEMGGGGARTRLVCGYLAGRPMPGNPVFGALPAVLRFDSRPGVASDWIRTTFAFAADEITAQRAGSTATLAKLSELLFVEAVRRYAETLPEGQTGWFAGLRDPYVSRALALLHARLSEPWTVDQLGREVGLSRSALAERFTQLIGSAPMQYLANWRMQVAAQELTGGNQPLIRIAQAVGYDSEAAFGRAFKRIIKQSPAAYRRQAREPAADS